MWQQLMNFSACVLSWLEDHPGLASWAQFAVTVIALVVAIYVIREPLRQADSLRLKDRAETLRAVAQNLSEAAEMYEAAASRAISTPRDYKADTEAFNSDKARTIAEAMKAAPFDRLHAASMSIKFIEARDKVTAGLDTLDRARDRAIATGEAIVGIPLGDYRQGFDAYALALRKYAHDFASAAERTER